MSIRSYALAVSLLVGSHLLSPNLHAQDGNVRMWHNLESREGYTSSELALSLTSVSAQTFGKVNFLPTDGVVDAQPLHLAGLSIGGKTRDVLYVATEHDSVYAFDAVTGQILWQTSLLKAGETTSDNRSCNQINPEIGITSTPFIDLNNGPNGAIYVVNMSKDSNGKYHHRINALDPITGGQLFGGPTEISATYPGTGDNSTNGTVVFDPSKYAERAALLEWNGAIYTAWTSHCDSRPYTGWIMGYSATTLKQTSVLNLTPNGNDGAIWMSGAGLASTPTKLFFLDGNGTFDSTLDGNGFPINQDFGNGFIALGQGPNGQLQVQDYYATDNTVAQSNSDIDLGSGGAMLFPSIYDNSGNEHLLAVGAGKDHNIYLVDRQNMGKYHPNGGYIYQVLTGALPNGEFSAPAYYDNKVYYGGVQDSIRAFAFSNAKLTTTPVSMTTNTFAFPGTTPSISSYHGTNGIVWALNHSNTQPSVLYAYNAEDLSQELYDSNQSGTRDQFGISSHFGTPTIIHGYVYVGTTTGVAVFGLLNQ